MDSLPKIYSILLLFVLIFNSGQTAESNAGEELPELTDETDDDYLYSKIDCNVGDKYDYAIATQSSLLNDKNEIVQMRTLLQLECLKKAQWLNETSGKWKSGQVFEAKISNIEPIRNIAVDGKDRGLQMAALFANLAHFDEKIPEPVDPNVVFQYKNVRLGTVNNFFEKLIDIGRWILEWLNKFWINFKNSRIKNGNMVQFNCDADIFINNEKRARRDNGKKMDVNQFSANYSNMYRHPFRFIQLEDGSIQNIHLSDMDKDPIIRQFKMFIASTFKTQLDERKKHVVEDSEFGKHMAHYQVEYDEPDSKKISPEQYIRNKYQNRTKRFTPHLVSIMRRFKHDDIIWNENKPANSEPKFNGLIRQSRVKKEDEKKFSKFNFDVQEVQLVRNNMIVASGGYFQGFLLKNADTNLKSQRLRREKNLDEAASFDQFLREHLDLNLQYSMVKLGENRPKRSIIETNDDTGSTINYADKIVKMFTNVNNDFGKYRPRREISLPKPNLKKVDCQTVNEPPKELSRLKSNHIVRSEFDFNETTSFGTNDYIECYEYKQFGSDLLNVHYNRSVIKMVRNDVDKRKLRNDNFVTQYKVGARFFSEELLMGRVSLAKTPDAARITLNLFGSEYPDINLCDVQDKGFSQSGSIPLYMDNIWFISNINLKAQYKVDFRINIPDLNCNGLYDNNEILNRAISENLKLLQATSLEFGTVAEASFLIFNGQMRINGDIDMDSLIDFKESCLSAKSFVKPFTVGVDFKYKIYHPICEKWMMDHFKPEPLSWKLSREYRNSWIHNACV